MKIRVYNDTYWNGSMIAIKYDYLEISEEELTEWLISQRPDLKDAMDESENPAEFARITLQEICESNAKAAYNEERRYQRHNLSFTYLEDKANLGCDDGEISIEEIIEDKESETPEEYALRVVEDEEFLNDIQILKPNYKDILYCVKFEHMGLEEYADFRGIEYENAKKRWQRACKTYKKAI